ncbi:MAG: hypothetical protein IAI49_01850 [Candidatus Eremiobacteraeota bacterium]|nr:hypothetical protein [Candidatus Eremiobacteraeota bacterium]
MPQIDEIGTVEEQRPALRFSIDSLREAGASLGPIQTTVVRPKVTFEGLIKRANELQKRAGRRRVA